MTQRPYTLTGAPAPWVAMNWYPGAHVTDYPRVKMMVNRLANF